MYGKTFTRASRDTWTLLVHHSGVDALVQRELISTALTLSAVLSGLVCSLVCGVWAKSALGDEHPDWWQAVVASFIIGFGSVSLVSVTVESGTNALFVCYAEDPSPLAAISTPLYQLFIQHPHVAVASAAESAAAGVHLGGAADYALQPAEEKPHEGAYTDLEHPPPPPPMAAPPPSHEADMGSYEAAAVGGEGAADRAPRPATNDSMADALGIGSSPPL